MGEYINMSINCTTCCKIFCKKRDSLEECREKISFFDANIINTPERKENNELESNIARRKEE